MLPIIDHHTHVHLNYGHDAKTEAEDVLLAMDQAGVEVSIIIDVCGIYGNDYREGNDHAAEAVRRHPGRLLAFAYLHPMYAGIEACLDEADRCVNELGFKGLKIHPVTDYHPINSREYVYPLVEKAVALDLPLFIHTGHPPMSGPILVADLARKFPQSKLILGHLGHAQFSDACYVGLEYPNVYADLSMNHFGAIKNAYRAFGPERMLFGSDSPTSHPIGAKSFVENLPIPVGEKEQILGGNIIRLCALEF